MSKPLLHDLISLTTESHVALDTFFPSRLAMKSPGLMPLMKACLLASTLPIIHGQLPVTVKLQRKSFFKKGFIEIVLDVI